MDTNVREFDGLDMGFEVVEGFSRPDWKRVRSYIKNRVPPEDRKIAWNHAARSWLQEMAGDLGGGSRIYETSGFFCLSDLDPDVTERLLEYAETALDYVRGCLRSAAWTGYNGRHVLLLFADPDDYFAYISYFYPEGTHVLSAGVFIRRGYAHIALPFVDVSRAQRTLTHELVHNLLCHLPIPKWLNEGLAETLERPSQRSQFVLDIDMVDRHREFWNETNIQTFWAGTSYGVPGDSSQLSYNLGEILVGLLAEKGDHFTDFVKHADSRDGGQDAAVTWLDVDLGEVLGGFLGPGKWRPQRKAIAECFNGKMT